MKKQLYRFPLKSIPRVKINHFQTSNTCSFFFNWGNEEEWKSDRLTWNERNQKKVICGYSMEMKSTNRENISLFIDEKEKPLAKSINRKKDVFNNKIKGWQSW
jgi:hypothetical protein